MIIVVPLDRPSWVLVQFGRRRSSVASRGFTLRRTVPMTPTIKTVAKGYQPVSIFWTMVVPALVITIVIYVSKQPGWVGYRIRTIIGPIVDPISGWVAQWFI